MKSFRSILSNFIFVFNVLLLILLIFREQVVVPVWLQPAGRFHPMILHLPIALVVVLTLIILFRRNLGNIDALLEFLLYLTAFFAALSALLGLLLSREEGYDKELLSRHMWAGISISILCYILLMVYRNPGKLKWLFNTVLVATFISVILGSHFGATITHGEGYLFQSIQDEVKKKNIIITDSTPIFAAVVEPILESKCYNCHNEKKSKGDLVMTKIEKLLKGGKDGPIWKAGDPLNSHIIQRLQLEETNKKHMPPKGKPQLTPEEIKFLHEWITHGADMAKAFRDYPVTDSFRLLATRFVQPVANIFEDTVQYTFEFADEKLVKKLDNPNRTISRLATNSPALDARFFIRQQYQPRYLEELKPLKQQIVSINLTNMPVKDEELKTIGEFTHLEKLILNGTDITGKTFSDLKSCVNLKSVSISNTKIKTESLTALSAIRSLKEVFIWNTGIMSNQLAAVEQTNSSIKWYAGYTPDSTEKLKLTAPQLKLNDKLILAAGDSIILTHPMPGVTIRYTTDGSDPDSTSSPVYQKPFTISAVTEVKTRATRVGWYSSNINSFTLFTQGILPSKTYLLNPPDPNYSAQGEATLTDLKKADITMQKMGWLGFREKSLIAGFLFAQPVALNKITLSFGEDTGPFIFPPQHIKIWGGEDSLHLGTIGELTPVQPSKYEPSKNLGLIVSVKKGNYKYIKIEAIPVPKLPKWHGAKGKKAWIFIDEVFFQ